MFIPGLLLFGLGVETEGKLGFKESSAVRDSNKDCTESSSQGELW